MRKRHEIPRFAWNKGRKDKIKYVLVWNLKISSSSCFSKKLFYIRAPKNRLLSFDLEKELLIENQSFVGENKRLQNKTKT